MSGLLCHLLSFYEYTVLRLSDDMLEQAPKG